MGPQSAGSRQFCSSQPPLLPSTRIALLTRPFFTPCIANLKDFQAITSRNRNTAMLHCCQPYTCQRLDCSGAAFQPTSDKTGNAVGGTVTSRHWHEQKLASRIKGWQNCLQKYMSESQDYVGHPPDPCFFGTLPVPQLPLLLCQQRYCRLMTCLHCKALQFANMCVNSSTFH